MSEWIRWHSVLLLSKICSVAPPPKKKKRALLEGCRDKGQRPTRLFNEDLILLNADL